MTEAVTDTLPEVAREFRARMALMTPGDRLQMASGMYDLAREIILASLPPDLPEPERDYRLFVRMHGAAFEPLARKAFLERRRPGSFSAIQGCGNYKGDPRRDEK